MQVFHLIGSHHSSHFSAKIAAAYILIHFSGAKCRLHTHHSFPFYFAVGTIAIKNEPMTAMQLYWKWIIISGIVGNGFPAFLFATAQQKIPSAQAGILNALSPLFVVIMSRVLFGAKFPAGKIIGIVVGLCGAVLILARNGGAFDFGENFQYGLLIVLATIGYGISASIMKYRLSHAPAEMVSSFAISMAGIPALFYLFLGTPFIAVLTEKPGAWLATFYIVILGVMGTGIALILFNRLLKLKDVVFASSVTYLMPLVALSWGLGSGESFGLTQAIGLFLIIAGVYLMSFKRVATLQFSENENQ